MAEAVAADDDSGIEQVHCVVPKVYVFQIPTTTSVSTGFSARDWPKKAIWSGRLRVISKGNKASVVLEHIDKEGVFAVCPYNNKNAVEQVNDSSRYFVIRVEGAGGRSAAVGIGFKERNEAFDFRIALQDSSKSGDKAKEYLSSLPTQDYSLSAGETIHVNVPGAKAPEAKTAAAAPVGGPVMKLAAPGAAGDAGKKKKKKKVIGPEPVGTRTPVTRIHAAAAPHSTAGGVQQPAKPIPSTVDSLTADLFGMNMDGASKPAAAAPVPAKAAAQPAAASDNPFDVFDF
eukprot:gb/GEZN01008063.1/.p1 GENE.gb/GEZN01008063.1/~~gb/GEZN01008063.1/.p1  ORF type:complete len:287 (-),score=63.25 gb/GEZN01008063.1/:466-1326(-)